MRITNSERKGIIEQETNNKFYDLFAELENKINVSIIEEVKKTIPKNILSSKFQNYFHKSNDVSFSGNNKEVAKKAGYRYHYMEEYLPIEYGQYEFKIELKGNLLKLMKQFIQLTEKRESFKKDLYSLLYSYTSVKKLIEVMPEFGKYFTHKALANQNAIVPIELIEKVKKNLAIVKES